MTTVEHAVPAPYDSPEQPMPYSSVIEYRVVLHKTNGAVRETAAIDFERDAREYASEYIEEVPVIERAIVQERRVRHE